VSCSSLLCCNTPRRRPTEAEPIKGPVALFRVQRLHGSPAMTRETRQIWGKLGQRPKWPYCMLTGNFAVDGSRRYEVDGRERAAVSCPWEKVRDAGVGGFVLTSRQAAMLPRYHAATLPQWQCGNLPSTLWRTGRSLARERGSLHLRVHRRTWPLRSCPAGP